MVNRVEEGEEGRVKVVIYEGWCVGFRALEDGALKGRWEEAVRKGAEERAGGYVGRLGRSRFADVRFVNEALRGYDALTEYVEPFSPFFALFGCFCRGLLRFASWLAVQHQLTSSFPLRPLASSTLSSTCKSPASNIPYHHALTTSLPRASDALHMTDVYAWRQDQERALRATKGTGMSDEQVIRFVDGCTFSPFPPFLPYPCPARV